MRSGLQIKQQILTPERDGTDHEITVGCSNVNLLHSSDLRGLKTIPLNGFLNFNHNKSTLVRHCFFLMILKNVWKNSSASNLVRLPRFVSQLFLVVIFSEAVL